MVVVVGVLSVNKKSINKKEDPVRELGKTRQNMNKSGPGEKKKGGRGWRRKREKKKKKEAQNA